MGQEGREGREGQAGLYVVPGFSRACQVRFKGGHYDRPTTLPAYLPLPPFLPSRPVQAFPPFPPFPPFPAFPAFPRTAGAGSP